MNNVGRRQGRRPIKAKDGKWLPIPTRIWTSNEVLPCWWYLTWVSVPSFIIHNHIIRRKLLYFLFFLNCAHKVLYNFLNISSCLFLAWPHHALFMSDEKSVATDVIFSIVSWCSALSPWHNTEIPLNFCN